MGSVNVHCPRPSRRLSMVNDTILLSSDQRCDPCSGHAAKMRRRSKGVDARPPRPLIIVKQAPDGFAEHGLVTAITRHTCTPGEDLVCHQRRLAKQNLEIAS